MTRRRFFPLFGDRLARPKLPSLPPAGPHELPPCPRGAHFHVCRCGNYLTCYSLPDRCPTFEPWDCPTCERAALDEYFSKQERSLTTDAHLR